MKKDVQDDGFGPPEADGGVVVWCYGFVVLWCFGFVVYPVE